MPVSLTRSTALSFSSVSASVTLPTRVNLRAFESRLSTIFSHISASTRTGRRSSGN